jgi:inorganic pyrophosphatase
VLQNATVTGSKGHNDASINDIPAASPQPAAPIDPSISKWFFISSSSF